jgi:hypothetical protein
MQLRAFEKQNKERLLNKHGLLNGRLMMARQEQDSASSIELVAPDASALQYRVSHSGTEGHSTRIVESQNVAEPKGHEFNLDFSTLENSDVLDHFDFDRSLKPADATSTFDAATGVGQNVATVRPGYPSSLSTINSDDQSMSFENSFEVNDTNLATMLAHHDVVNLLGEMHDDEDDDPWASGRYLSQVDSSNMIGAEDMEDSLYVETGGPSSSDMSMLSSQYASSFLQAPDSVTASQFINGIGAASANQFLPLTAPPADYPGARTRQTCQPHLTTPRIDAPEVLGYPSDFDDYIARWTRLSDFEYANTATYMSRLRE